MPPRAKGLEHLIDNRQPLPRGRLPKQTEARIPGTISAIPQPTGVSTEGQQQPARVSERSSEMGGRGIDRNQQIQIADPTRVFSEGGRLGDAFRGETMRPRSNGGVIRPHLQRNQLCPLLMQALDQCSEDVGGQGTLFVLANGEGIVLGAASSPDQANPWRRDRGMKRPNLTGEVRARRLQEGIKAKAVRKAEEGDMGISSRQQRGAIVFSYDMNLSAEAFSNKGQ